MKVKKWTSHNELNNELLGTSILFNVTLYTYNNTNEELNLSMIITHNVQNNLTIGKLTETCTTFGTYKKDEWSSITELYNFSVKECWKYLHHLVRDYIRQGYDFYLLDDMDIFQYYPRKTIANRVQDMDIMIKTNKDIAFKWYMATPDEKRNYFKLELNY